MQRTNLLTGRFQSSFSRRNLLVERRTEGNCSFTTMRSPIFDESAWRHYRRRNGNAIRSCRLSDKYVQRSPRRRAFRLCRSRQPTGRKSAQFRDERVLFHLAGPAMIKSTFARALWSSAPRRKLMAVSLWSADFGSIDKGIHKIMHYLTRCFIFLLNNFCWTYLFDFLTSSFVDSKLESSVCHINVIFLLILELRIPFLLNLDIKSEFWKIREVKCQTVTNETLIKVIYAKLRLTKKKLIIVKIDIPTIWRKKMLNAST